jgi:hypothetical protein
MMRAISIADLVSRPADASFGRSVGRVCRSAVSRETEGSIGDEGMVNVDIEAQFRLILLYSVDAWQAACAGRKEG